MPKNLVPVVDKALHLLDLVAESRTGISLSELVERLGIPRSTVYRVLNTFLVHDYVVRIPGSGLFRLGPKISSLSLMLPPANDRARLLDVAAPLMQGAAERIGEAFKLSVREKDAALTIHATPSPSEYGLNVRAGHSASLHAGGAGKVLLAYAEPADIERVVSAPLEAFTAFTITDRDTLLETLLDIRARGYGEDAGELRSSVHSIAVPVWGAEATVVAALSIPFVGSPPPERMRKIRQSALDTAQAVSRGIGGITPGSTLGKVQKGTGQPILNSTGFADIDPVVT